jgi:hypothetical protein
MAKNGEKKNAEFERAKRQVKGLRTARRSASYIMYVVVIAAFIAALCVLAFFTCARLANLYIMANEGMALRAECILTEGSIIELRSYFTEDCIASDSMLQDDAYYDYSIDNYDYSLTISNFRIWKASMEVVERISGISGSANSDSVDSQIPKWTPIRYKLEFERINGKWYISSIAVEEIDPIIAPAATPDFSLEPVYTQAPTPQVAD